MRLSIFTERTGTAHIEIMDESGENKLDELDVTYRPAIWTPEFEERMRPQAGGEWSTSVFAQALAETVVKWTLTEEQDGARDGISSGDAVEVPHTYERLVRLPTSLLSQVVAGISNDMRPKAKSNGSSKNGT